MQSNNTPGLFSINQTIVFSLEDKLPSATVCSKFQGWRRVFCRLRYFSPYPNSSAVTSSHILRPPSSDTGQVYFPHLCAFLVSHATLTARTCTLLRRPIQGRMSRRTCPSIEPFMFNRPKTALSRVVGQYGASSCQGSRSTNRSGWQFFSRWWFISHG